MAGTPITVRLAPERGAGGCDLYEVSGIVAHPVLLDGNQLNDLAFHSQIFKETFQTMVMAIALADIKAA